MAHRPARAFACFLGVWFGAGTALAGGLSSDQALTAQALRTYCRACHGIGTDRFIYSDDDQELWTYIQSNREPMTGKIWADAILEVLTWPSDTPPPFDQLMDPGRHLDWMPKGVKRLQLATAQVGDESVRQLLVRTLQGAK